MLHLPYNRPAFLILPNICAIALGVPRTWRVVHRAPASPSITLLPDDCQEAEGDPNASLIVKMISWQV